MLNIIPKRTVQSVHLLPNHIEHTLRIDAEKRFNDRVKLSLDHEWEFRVLLMLSRLNSASLMDIRRWRTGRYVSIHWENWTRSCETPVHFSNEMSANRCLSFMVRHTRYVDSINRLYIVSWG
jgi:hypothetical protein